MACKTSFELHHNFPKLAEESGFTFNTHKPRVVINWTKIKHIDIENVIRERKFAVVEQHVHDILDCVLESEFDVRILDEGVLKIFRLAQLAVEYQQFCRHYLDRSVFILKEEVTNLLQELDATKRNLREKEDEIRKLKRKCKHTTRTNLPYGNENIAAMILKTLNQNKGELFTSTSQIDSMQYNKCNYCEKVFLNQLYLKSHISRRHANLPQTPQRDRTDSEINNGINAKLTSEVDELKTKLKQMEDLIVNNYNPCNETTKHSDLQPNTVKDEVISNNRSKTELKDVEVSTNDDGYILEKIQEWKNEEHQKYYEELSSLRKQIIDIMSAKEKQENMSAHSDLKMMEQLHATIKQQGTEILALKQALTKEENRELEKRKKIEEQVDFWIKRAEKQSDECKLLLQKLNDVANEAQEFRLIANSEKERANELEKLLQHHLKQISPSHSKTVNEQNLPNHGNLNQSLREFKSSSKNVQTKPLTDAMTLKKLQQKAQELLNIDESTITENSSANEEIIESDQMKKSSDHDNIVKAKKTYVKVNHQDLVQLKPKTTLQTYDREEPSEMKYIEKKQSSSTPKSTINTKSKKGNGYVYVPGSPIKIVRAKITEEVNHRLISLGVDPLNNRLSQHIFQKQRKLLQEQQDCKAKKWPSREKILHSIMSDLDKNTSTNSNQRLDHLTNKSRKSFSLSSVLSNVKTKALSLVKSNEPSMKHNKTYDNVAKKAMALLKTPPGSAHSSPILLNSSKIDSPKKKHTVLKSKKVQYLSSKKKTKNKPEETRQNTDSSNESSSENYVHHDQSKIAKNVIISPHHQSIQYENNVNSHNSINHTKKILSEHDLKTEAVNVSTKTFLQNTEKNNFDNVEITTSPRKFASEENLNISKQAKGVLKNASSTSCLNKKKVIFDMEAIQMKSVSASPSQSITDKSGSNENYGIGIVNLDAEEWDISSIENEPIRTVETKIQISSHTSPKIAELKKTIESQLSGRNPNLSTALIGGVDVLAVPVQKPASHGGSNTSLGSSILDDTDSAPALNHKAILKPRKAFEKDDSDLEISDIIDTKIINK